MEALKRLFELLPDAFWIFHLGELTSLGWAAQSQRVQREVSAWNKLAFFRPTPIYFSTQKTASTNSLENTGSCCLVASQMAATLGWQGLLFLMSCAHTKAKHLELPCGLSIWPWPHTSLNQMCPNNCELNSMNDSWRSGRRGPPPETSQPLWLELWKGPMNMHEALKAATGGWFVKWCVFDHRGESSCGFPWLEERTFNVQLPESLNY